MFVVTPIDMQHFPPVISVAISYAVNGDTTLQRVDLQNDPMRRVQPEVFDKHIATKAPHLLRASMTRSIWKTKRTCSCCSCACGTFRTRRSGK